MCTLCCFVVAAITRRKVELSEETLVRAINTVDLAHLSTEKVEILQRVLPNDKEIKAFKQFETERKSIATLSDEDRFLYSVRQL